jgi:hypothetical protein
LELTAKILRDCRPSLLDLSVVSQDDGRPTVEELQKKYASVVDVINEESSNKIITFTKQRGNQEITKTIMVSNIVRQTLNRALPKIRKLSRQFDGFSASQFKLLLKIGGTSTQKYINILLATNILKSDNSKWSARYKWNDGAGRRKI